jgi:S1-C subfamily serine protease
LTAGYTLKDGMRKGLRSNFIASILGGLVVATAFLALGLTGQRSVRTVVDEAPLAAQPVPGAALGLTAHDIYLRDAPGVVYVRAVISRQVDNPFDPTPERLQSTATGAGFLVARDGLIITSFHVIDGADPQHGITIRFEDNTARTAAVVGEDQDDDLAVLKVPMGGLSGGIRPLELGNSATVRVGDPTLAIGNPFGLDRTLTGGIVSALQRRITTPAGLTIRNVIQTDAPVTPGSSGGPLIDADGRVIGVTSQIVTDDDDDGGDAGIAFAVPINTVKSLLRPGDITAS